jgi:hypothetical protein
MRHILSDRILPGLVTDARPVLASTSRPST